MSAFQQVPADDPLMIAWAAFKETDKYRNIMYWIEREHYAGETWALFVAGYEAATKDHTKTITLIPQKLPIAPATCQYHEWLRLGKEFTGFVTCPYCSQPL